jgi:hypothetical protein
LPPAASHRVYRFYRCLEGGHQRSIMNRS